MTKSVASTARVRRLALLFGVAAIATWPSSEALAGPATGPLDSTSPSSSSSTGVQQAEPATGEVAVDPATLGVSSEVSRARELAANGRALFQEASYDAAIAAFTEAFSLVRDPNLLYNISVAHERAGRYSEAADALDRYRVYATTEEREHLTSKAAQLRTQADQQRAQHEAAKAREAREADGAAGVGDPVNGEGPQAQGRAGEPPVLVEPEEPKLFGPAAWVLTGTTVVGLGLGLGLGVSASKQDAKAGGFCEGSLCASAASSYLDKARRHALGADLSFAVAGLSAASLAVVLGVKAGRSKERKANRLQVDPVAGRSELGLRVRGRF